MAQLIWNKKDMNQQDDAVHCVLDIGLDLTHDLIFVFQGQILKISISQEALQILL